MADSITPKELKELMDSDRQPALFDVRRRVDYEAAPKRIGGSVWLDPEKEAEWAPGIPQNRPVVVYCVKGGSVSQSIADRLLQSHPGVRFLQGGIKAWAEAGEPVEE